MEGSITRDTTPDFMTAGSLVGGRYRIERPLGRGGMGTVYAATHLMTDRPVALKVMMATMAEDPVLVARFVREARTASTISHPNAIEVLDVFRDKGDAGPPVMVMELLDGENLAQRIARAGALSIAEVARVCVPVLGALAVAHSKGVVHRDLKPDNIFLSVRDGKIVPKVLDFGIAKVLKDKVSSETMKLTNTGVMLGTPYYMAPEQAAGRPIDHRTDLWSMGVVIYEALTARRPFEGENFGQLFAAVLQDDPAPIRERAPGLPEDVAALVDRCLEKKKEKRPESAGEMAAVLAPYADMAAIALPAPSSPRVSNAGPGVPPDAPTIAEKAGGEPRPGQHELFAVTGDAPTVASGQHAVAAPVTPSQMTPGTPAPVVSTAPAMAPPAPRRTGLVIAAGAALVLVLVGIGFAAAGGLGSDGGETAPVGASPTAASSPRPVAPPAPVASAPVVQVPAPAPAPSPAAVPDAGPDTQVSTAGTRTKVRRGGRDRAGSSAAATTSAEPPPATTRPAPPSDGLIDTL